MPVGVFRPFRAGLSLRGKMYNTRLTFTTEDIGNMNSHKFVYQMIFTVTALLWQPLPLAATYGLDRRGDLIGEVRTVRAERDDTLLDIARANSLGLNELKLINPEVDTWLPGEGKEIMLPAMFVLPQAPRDGIVLNIPEMRLYYFPPPDRGDAKRGKNRKNSRRDRALDRTLDRDNTVVITYPLGIGRQGWGTPYVNTKIAQKRKNPYWYPPESIRKEHAEDNDPLPWRVEPGPENPLGDYAMRLGLPEYLIHGTNKPYGIGMRVSHGCIRLYPEDIEALYGMVGLGTPVYIVNQPFKLGVQGRRIYLEAHPWLDEDTDYFRGSLTSILKMLLAISEDGRYEMDWDLARQVITDVNGMPTVVGKLLEVESAGMVDRYPVPGPVPVDMRDSGEAL